MSRRCSSGLACGSRPRDATTTPSRRLSARWSSAGTSCPTGAAGRPGAAACRSPRRGRRAVVAAARRRPRRRRRLDAQRRGFRLQRGGPRRTTRSMGWAPDCAWPSIATIPSASSIRCPTPGVSASGGLAATAMPSSSRSRRSSRRWRSATRRVPTRCRRRARRAGLHVSGRKVTAAWMSERRRSGRSRALAGVDRRRPGGRRVRRAGRARNAAARAPLRRRWPAAHRDDRSPLRGLVRERGLSPADRRSRGSFIELERDAGAAVAWPPGRNAPCWCTSGLKYKRCCGALTVSPTVEAAA